MKGSGRLIRMQRVSAAANEARIACAAALLVVLTACGGDDAAPQPAPNNGAVPDRVVAEVNGAPITARQLEQMREASLLTLGAVDLPVEGDALQLLIHGELLIQAARRRGIEIPQQAIDEQLRVCRSQFADDEELEQHLRSAGLDEESLRREAERRLLMKAYASEITGNLVVDESRAREIYEERTDLFPPAEQIRAAWIVVRVLPTEGAEERKSARQKIEEAAARLAAGEEFARVAEEVSESPFASRGGDLGFFPRGRMLPEFDEVVFATEVGDTTPIFETPRGYNIVKVLDRRDGVRQSFEEVKTGLLMVLARDQKNERLKNHLEELRAAATIRILDPGLDTR